MKTNYSKIRAALKDLDEARTELNKIARLRIGMISGGPSIAEESAEFERCSKTLVRLVRQAIANGCRLSRLQEVCGDEIVVSGMVRDAIDEREYERSNVG